MQCDMPLCRRILLALLLGFRLVLAQEAEPAAPAPPATAAAPEKAQEADPNLIPLDQNNWKPVKERKHRVPRHRNGNHRTLFGDNLVVGNEETVQDLLLFGGTADVQGTVDGDLVVIGGGAKISGTVNGNVVIIGGPLTCSGVINRDATVVLGSADLSEAAHVDHEAVFIGGPFKIAKESSILGERVLIPLGDVVKKIDFFKAWVLSGPLLGRLLSFTVTWAWVVAGFFVALYLVTLLLFPGAVKAVYLTLEERPVTSIVSGLLMLILFAPLVVVLVMSVVGIAVIPFLKIALILCLLFGKVGLMCFLGRSFGRASGFATLQAPFFAFLIGATVLLLAYVIPVFGILAWTMGTLFGLGGAIVALAGTFKREESAVPPASVMVSTIRPTTGVASEPPLTAAGTVASVPPSLATASPADTVLLQRAGFWKRLLAALLDLILLGLLTAAFGRPGFFIPLAVIYFVAMWTWKGTTIGSLLLGLKIVRSDGRPVNFAVALVRSLSSFFSVLVFFLGFLWAGWDREKQGWHDKIAGTVVVKMPKGFALI